MGPRLLVLLAILGIAYVGTLISHHQADRNERTLGYAPVVTARGALRVAGHVSLDGAPLAGAQVRLVGLGVPSRRVDRFVTSGSDGAFDLGEVGLTWFHVTATAPGANFDDELLAGVWSEEQPVRYDQLELELTRCDAPVAGTVVDLAGAPLAGVSFGPQADDRSITGADGGFRVCAPGGGDLVFRAVDKGGLRVRLPSSETIAPLRIEMAPAAAIEGRVVRADTGEPVADAPVWVLSFFTADPAPMGASAFAMTDRDGRFRLDQLAAGKAIVQASAPGMHDSMAHDYIETTVGQTTRDVVIELAPMR